MKMKLILTTTYLVAVLINIVLIASIFESETDALQRVFAN